MLPTFPDFLPLSLELKEPYQQKVGQFPAYSDSSFATLQIWWAVSENLLVSTLNNNLVIDYDLFTDKTVAGLGLIGTSDVDKSMETLFQYLKQQHRDVKLVHVPGFTIAAINDKAGFVITDEPDFREYILDSSSLSKLEGSDYKTLRKKIKRFNNSTAGQQVELKALDLSMAEVQDELLAAILEWERNNDTSNDSTHTEHQALKRTMQQAGTLDINGLAVYIDKKLQGLVTYHQPSSQDCYIMHHLKANYEHPYITDYLYHQVAKQAASEGVSRLNIEMDLGIENLKSHKMTLRPAHFFHKFTVKPA